MQHKVYAFLISMLFLSVACFAQEQNLAKIGSLELSVNEFIQRFEFTPKEKSDFDSTKVNFLYSLIAEKLWSLEAESLSMDTIPYVYNSVKNIERKLIRDKLYKIEIESKVQITDMEISDNLLKLNEKRVMNFLFSKSENEIELLYNELLSGKSIDSLLIDRVEHKQQIDGVPVVFGQMDEHLENIVYSLQINEFTKPIPVRVGWVIYYLKSIEAVQSETKNRKAVEEMLFARKAKIFYSEFFNKYVKGNRAYSDKRLFDDLVNEISQILIERGEDSYNENLKKYQLDGYQIKLIQNNFSPKMLLSDFIKFENSAISLKKYMLSLELNGYSCDKMSKHEIANVLNSKIKTYIFEEIIIREGYKRGLQNSEDIQNDLTLWKESFLASYYRNSFFDAIKTNETEVREFYDNVAANDSNSVTKTYIEVKDQIETGLYFNKLENLYIDKTVALAIKYGISVDTKVLNSVQVTDIEMIVYRTLGFSGEITAVPYLQSYYKWKSWLPKTLKKSLP
ncbi:MAG: hypothetical protein PF445_12575 [Melioribacteraceae bacterium]|jgi:hypothetical protein|nr:hypothetical protein [Melioribacteraceae bacterium]